MFVPDDQDILTDDKILELSKLFNNQQDLRDVAIGGLKIPSKTVEKHMHNNQFRMNEAAFCLFQEWLDNQTSPKIAFETMCQALESAKKASFIQAIKVTESGVLITRNSEVV